MADLATKLFKGHPRNKSQKENYAAFLKLSPKSRGEINEKMAGMHKAKALSKLKGSK